MRRADAVGIVGGGVSGLAAGLALARAGRRVLLFEANDKPGGCCATTTIDGYTFTDGAIYVAVPQLLDRAFEMLGLDRASDVPMRRVADCQRTLLPDGTAVTFGSGREVRIHGPDGDARSARLAQEIDWLLQRWRPVMQLFTGDLLLHPLSPARVLLKGWRYLPRLRGTLAAELQRRISDDAARAALAGTLLYMGHPASKLPVTSIVGLIALLDDGFFVPLGGMGSIPAALSGALRRAGGEIRLQTPVRKIRVANGRAAALELGGGDVVEVDAVVSTVSGMLTFGRLLDADRIPAAMRRKAARAPLSHRALSVQLGLANRIDVDSHATSVLPMMEQQDQFFRPAGGPPRWCDYTVPTVTMPEFAPAGGSIVEMFPPIDQAAPLAHWSADRTEAAAESAIEALSHRHDMSIKVRRIRGPQQYARDMHLFDGAVYGLSPAAPPSAQFPHRTPVGGLFQAGQTTYPGFGVSTSMLSGIFAARALMAADRGRP